MIVGEICRDQALVHSCRRRKECSHPVRAGKEVRGLAARDVDAAARAAEGEDAMTPLHIPVMTECHEDDQF
jgi:hypothetical protein